jgi:uncharacterized RDD family membrane protein YckC
VSHDPPSRGLVTPEAVPLALETATVGSRAVAYLLDLLLLGTGYLLLGLANTILGGGGFVPGWVGITLTLLLVFALQFGYPIGFETLWRGRTPGKAAMGLRVVTDEAAPVGVRHATIRATVGIFELLLLLGLPAVISSLVSSRGQRLGDLAAGTIVVRERRSTGALAVEAFAAPRGYEAYTAQLDVTAIGPKEYATVRDTLRRLPSLPDHATRWRIAQQVASALAPRVTPPPPPAASPETWLFCVAAAVQARRTSGGRGRGVGADAPARWAGPAGGSPTGAAPPPRPAPEPPLPPAGGRPTGDGPPPPPEARPGGFAPPR